MNTLEKEEIEVLLPVAVEVEAKLIAEDILTPKELAADAKRERRKEILKNFLIIKYVWESK